jgi:hypothetical protein
MTGIMHDCPRLATKQNADKTKATKARIAIIAQTEARLGPRGAGDIPREGHSDRHAM